MPARSASVVALTLAVASAAALAAAPAHEAAPSGAGEASPARLVTGTTVTIEPTARVSLLALAQADAARIGPPTPGAVEPPMPTPLGGVIDIAPVAPRTHGVSPIAPTRAHGAPMSSCQPLLNPVITDSFIGLEDAAVTIPPDTDGAVGPNHIVTMLNDRVRIHDRAGADLATLTLSQFWFPLTPSAPFDPVVQFDALSGRWIACCDSNRRSASSRVLFAISDTDDPTGVWSFFSIDVDGTNVAWADFPRMGANSTWIALTNNMFAIAGDVFQGASMWVIDKSKALAGGPITFSAFNYGFDEDLTFDTFGASLTPATTHDAGESTLWIIDYAGFSATDGENPVLDGGGEEDRSARVDPIQLHRLSKITGTGPAPVWSTATGGPFPDSGLFFVDNNYEPGTPGAAQLGTATTIATNGARIYDADVRNGHLWYCHVGGLPFGAPDRASAFWYEVDPAGDLNAPIAQSGVVDAPGVFHFFPSIAVNCADDMMLGFTRSSIALFAEAAYTWRNASDAPGTTHPVAQIKAGEDSYLKDFGSGSRRWGDYSATVVDPIDDRGMWTLQEYAALDVGPSTSDDRWGTWWGRLFAAPVCVGDVNGDGFTNSADFNILASNFGNAVPPNTLGDLTGDGLVNSADFNVLAGDFGCMP